MSRGVDQSFGATADFRAAVFGTEDIGTIVQDREAGMLYHVLSAGTNTLGACVSALAKASVDIGLSLNTWFEVTSANDVSNIAANGGLLASDTTPAAQADATQNTMEISWVTGNADIIARQVSLPSDFDGTRDVTLTLEVYSGTTNDATFSVITSWDNGTPVTDSAAETAKSATRHSITATIDKADVPDSPKNLTISLTPPTHATDAIALCGSKLTYFRK